MDRKYDAFKDLRFSETIRWIQQSPLSPDNEQGSGIDKNNGRPGNRDVAEKSGHPPRFDGHACSAREHEPSRIRTQAAGTIDNSRSRFQRTSLESRTLRQQHMGNISETHRLPVSHNHQPEESLYTSGLDEATRRCFTIFEHYKPLVTRDFGIEDVKNALIRANVSPRTIKAMKAMESITDFNEDHKKILDEIINQCFILEQLNRSGKAKKQANQSARTTSDEDEQLRHMLIGLCIEPDKIEKIVALNPQRMEAGELDHTLKYEVGLNDRETRLILECLKSTDEIDAFIRNRKRIEQKDKEKRARQIELAENARQERNKQKEIKKFNRDNSFSLAIEFSLRNIADPKYDILAVGSQIDDRTGICFDKSRTVFADIDGRSDLNGDIHTTVDHIPSGKKFKEVHLDGLPGCVFNDATANQRLFQKLYDVMEDGAKLIVIFGINGHNYNNQSFIDEILTPAGFGQFVPIKTPQSHLPGASLSACKMKAITTPPINSSITHDSEQQMIPGNEQQMMGKVNSHSSSATCIPEPANSEGDQKQIRLLQHYSQNELGETEIIEAIKLGMKPDESLLELQTHQEVVEIVRRFIHENRRNSPGVMDIDPEHPYPITPVTGVGSQHHAQAFRTGLTALLDTQADTLTFDAGPSSLIDVFMAIRAQDQADKQEIQRLASAESYPVTGYSHGAVSVMQGAGIQAVRNNCAIASVLMAMAHQGGLRLFTRQIEEAVTRAQELRANLPTDTADERTNRNLLAVLDRLQASATVLAKYDAEQIESIRVNDDLDEIRRIFALPEGVNLEPDEFFEQMVIDLRALQTLTGCNKGIEIFNFPVDKRRELAGMTMSDAFDRFYLDEVTRNPGAWQEEPEILVLSPPTFGANQRADMALSEKISRFDAQGEQVEYQLSGSVNIAASHYVSFLRDDENGLLYLADSMGMHMGSDDTRPFMVPTMITMPIQGTEEALNDAIENATNASDKAFIQQAKEHWCNLSRNCRLAIYTRVNNR